MQKKTLNGERLIAIGGNEDRTGDLIVLRRVVQEIGKHNYKVVVITTASKEPEQRGKEYCKVFESLKASEIEILNINEREQANNEIFIGTLEGSDLIFFSGGDQLRLTSIIGGSKILQAVRNQLKLGCIVAGSSAGAAVLSETMIYEGSSEEGLIKGKVYMAAGFGFVKNIVFDTHFMSRGRIGRLIQIVTTNPSCIGVGIAENCGVIFRENAIFEVFGKGNVLIVDGSNISYSNVTSIKPGEFITVENIRISSLSDAYKYDFKHKKLLKHES